jgi:hypothetical protein
VKSIEPLNLLHWFWGDISELDAVNRRKRIKFHNSIKYRAQMLDFYIVIKLIDKSEIRDLEKIRLRLKDVHPEAGENK